MNLLAIDSPRAQFDTPFLNFRCNLSLIPVTYLHRLSVKKLEDRIVDLLQECLHQTSSLEDRISLLESFKELSHRPVILEGLTQHLLDLVADITAELEQVDKIIGKSSKDDVSLTPVRHQGAP